MSEIILSPSTAANFTSFSEAIAPAAILSGVLTVDLSSATNFGPINNNANITSFIILNPTPSRVNSFTLIFVADGTQRSQTWGGSIKWPNSVPPVTTAAPAGVFDTISFVSYDGGGTWLGYVGGQSFS
jgi:hypothetical protein